jgi:hypothetical protein
MSDLRIRDYVQITDSNVTGTVLDIDESNGHICVDIYVGPGISHEHDYYQQWYSPNDVIRLP